MNLSDWFDYLFVYPALYAYWKATFKYLVSHLSSLFWVVLGFITFTVAKGENTMNKSELLDYAVAHPVALPFWIWAFLYLFMALSPEGWLGAAIALVFFMLWLRVWILSLTTIIEAQSALPTSDTGKELLPCIQA